jgi:C4-dicarboxylate-specific signal transduction histidine kinase
VVNLIRNALQAMHQQQPGNRQLRLRLQQHGDRVELSVADSGPGFPEAYSSDTSWELLKSTKASGMGIGLFIAQTAATNHHGQLSIGRSSELGGAEVVIELPIIHTIHK